MKYSLTDSLDAFELHDELHKTIQRQVTLSTPSSDIKNELILGSDYRSEPPLFTANIKYENAHFCGNGKMHTWEDAFASLQRKLPEGVKIKCCMTCRHGNMCPVGDVQGKLFCTKDVTITEKSDLYFYTEDEFEASKRSRDCADICESYKEQSEDFYTYNDYLYCLDKADNT